MLICVNTSITTSLSLTGWEFQSRMQDRAGLHPESEAQNVWLMPYLSVDAYSYTMYVYIYIHISIYIYINTYTRAYIET